MVLPQHKALLCLLIVRCVQTWHLESPRVEQMLCRAGSHPLCPDPCEGRGSSEPGQGEKRLTSPSAGQQGCPGVGWDPGAVQGT